MSSGKTVGTILIVVGVIVLILGVALVLSDQIGEDRLDPVALVIGLVLAVILSLPFLGVGAYLIVRGRAEEAQMAEVKKQKRILEMITTQGEVSIPELAIKLDASRDQVKAWIYDLVGKGLFSGYIDWDDGLLISRRAAELRGNKCPNCGGEVELSGKGVVSCPYCGTEVFLT